MDLVRTERFAASYKRLARREQRQVDTRLRYLAENLRHPSLRARKWGDSGLWYARVNSDIRIFFEALDDHYLLLDVGHHDVERWR